MSLLNKVTYLTATPACMRGTREAGKEWPLLDGWGISASRSVLEATSGEMRGRYTLIWCCWRYQRDSYL